MSVIDLRVDWVCPWCDKKITLTLDAEKHDRAKVMPSTGTVLLTWHSDELQQHAQSHRGDTAPTNTAPSTFPKWVVPVGLCARRVDDGVSEAHDGRLMHQRQEGACIRFAANGVTKVRQQ